MSEVESIKKASDFLDSKIMDQASARDWEIYVYIQKIVLKYTVIVSYTIIEKSIRNIFSNNKKFPIGIDKLKNYLENKYPCRAKTFASFLEKNRQLEDAYQNICVYRHSIVHSTPSDKIPYQYLTVGEVIEDHKRAEEVCKELRDILVY